MRYDLIVIGGGAAGCFTAIRLAEFHPGAKIVILEAAKKPLSKVEISGGGRCNVTHACYDPKKLIEYYPRGSTWLSKPFNEFHPKHLEQWFRDKGVKLKTESDGRVFPISDDSMTIINCFLGLLKKYNIQLITNTRASKWTYSEEHHWQVELFQGGMLESNYLLAASGSDQRIWNEIKAFGHHVIPPVPSLFTFNIRYKELNDLMGISMSHVKLTIPLLKLQSEGPFLITHWGVSGPAVLKLSAWGARELHHHDYVFDLVVTWINEGHWKKFNEQLQALILATPKRQVNKLAVPGFPARLWKYLCDRAGVLEFMSGAEFGKKQLKGMEDTLIRDTYRVTGKSTFKEEFVTAGGVDLDEVSNTTFESKLHPSLYLVGEVLNIDALTGGFNFQAAWTGAHIAAKAIAHKL